ncbi:TetR/AcrR family transcriptional regulator [Mucilaginibacter sp.]|jgi:AcrR family transcriptional regulator|uniref:TetR/AcrR family transcriptional regulator n=1 Tax=Mucilaginibacter sp. TaxID=1882438 RepID=UPI003565F9FD
MTKLTNNSLQERKETMLMIAEEVFAQYSFAGATIRLIAERSGMNSAMISYYFGSKEALYLNIFKLRLEEMAQEISRFELLDLDPLKKLNAYLTTYIGRVVSNQNFNRLLCNELVSVQHSSIIAQLSEARNRLYNFLLKMITSGIAKGYFKKIDEEVFVLNVLALVRSVFTDHLTTRIHLNELPQRNFARRIVDYLMSTITIEDPPSN